MRYINGFFCLVLALFALMQYNDPDFLAWFLVYGIAALWAGWAAFDARSLAAQRWLLAAFGASLLAAIIGTAYMWPAFASGWIDVETEREGAGLMVVTLGLLIVALTVWLVRRPSNSLHRV